ncbi:MAG: right-handed parallel beta-helix repeat-containing protein [Candidatus Methanofastidiosia archaeon]
MKEIKKWATAMIVLSLLFSVSSFKVSAATRYVATTGTDSGDCTSSPCRTITYAVSVASGGDTISVAVGIYDRAGGEIFPISIDGMSLTLVGAGAATTIIDGWKPGTPRDAVRVGFSGTATLNISGFTIRNAKLVGLRYLNGSSGSVTLNTITGNSKEGIRNESSSPTISSNTITANTLDGIHNLNSSNPIISNNTITGNYRYGIYNEYSDPTITGNNITGNYDHGINNYDSDPPIINNTITGNSRSGIYNTYSNPTITNNIITGNSRDGINNGKSDPTITNNTLTGNSFNGIYNYSSSPTITNNIITSNGYYGIDATGGISPTNTYNDVWNNSWGDYGGTASAGVGSISKDPLFVSPADYHLQCHSPAVNTGDNSAPAIPSTDKDGNPRIIGGVVDMGAYEANCERYRNIPSIRPLAVNRISETKNLFEKAQFTCDELKDKEDPKFDECCSEDKLNEVIELLKTAEKLFASGNYIAASNYALKAIEILEEILECCEG